MKDLRIKVLEEEYESIRSDAEQLQLSVRQLIHDRATGRDGIQATLYGSRPTGSPTTPNTATTLSAVTMNTDGNGRW